MLLVVLAVVVVSCTSITSLALLVTVTEKEGLRAALDRGDADQTAIDVAVDGPTVPIIEAETAAAAAVDYVLADSATTSSTSFAQSSVTALAGLDYAEPVSAYFGESERIGAAATIIDGEWPAIRGGIDDVTVAVPESAAAAIGLAVGESFTVGGATVEVVGIYRVTDSDGAFWAPDLLKARGIARGFILPRTSAYIAGEVIGPLVLPPKSLDRLATPLGVIVASLDMRIQPDFGTVDPTDIGTISDRLSTAGDRDPSRIGDIGERVRYSSPLAAVIDDAAASLLLTRTTVITIGLLLLLVAVVSLAQTARLVVDSRLDERRLLRARGASAASIRGMSGIEAGAIGLAATAVSPLLASAVYGALAAQPAMVAAGMPPHSGLPPVVWLVATAVSIAFVVVLLAPLVRPAELFDGDAQRAARGGRSLGIGRLGIDLGVAAFAVLSYQQLVTYRPPADAASVRIDPILVLAPTVLLAACAILAMRLVPVVGAALERIGSQSPGAVLPLASWEIGRRTRKATAVILLLTVSLSVGSFGATFLATWRQSQIDQVALAFGAPARVIADPETSSTQAGVLADGARGDPQPVIRRIGQVTGPSPGGLGAAAPRGPEALILGLTSPARSLINRDRNATEGGSVIEQQLASDVPNARSVDLPVSATGMTATVRIDADRAPFPGVAATVSAIVEDERGLLSSLLLGAVPVDGMEHPVRGELSPVGTVGESNAQRSIVGITVRFSVTDRGSFVVRDQATSADIYFQDVAAEIAAPEGATAITVAPLPLESLAKWSPQTATRTQTPLQLIDAPSGSQLVLRVSIPEDAGGPDAVYSLTGWEPNGIIPVVAIAPLAESMAVRVGARLTLLVSDVTIPCELVGIVPFVPGSQSAAHGSDTVDRAPVSDASSVVVVDQMLLSRALLSAGSPDSTVDEWWVDVAPGDGAAFVDRHRDEMGKSSVSSAEVVVVEQAEGPLRIATVTSLWLVIGAAVLLAATGFAVHTAASMRSRRTEFAQLRALGLGRRSLVTVVGVESLLISALGTVLGIAIGVLLGSAVASLVGISPDGSAPQPSVAIVVPVGVIAGLALVVALLVVSAVLAVAGRQRSADPASILRGPDG